MRSSTLAVVNALLPQFHNFISAMIKCRAAAAMEEVGGENISRPGLRSGEPSEFRSNVGVCKFYAADHSANARTVSSRLRLCCRFLHVPTVGLALPGR